MGAILGSGSDGDDLGGRGPGGVAVLVAEEGRSLWVGVSGRGVLMEAIISNYFSRLFFHTFFFNLVRL